MELGNNVTMKLVLIPAGKFIMGSSTDEQMLAKSQTVESHIPVGDYFTNEGPQHEVTISRPFYMGQTVVTQSQWTAVMGTTIAQQREKADKPWPFGREEGPDFPMYYVSWHEAMEFCTKLSQKTGKTVSLPTEAQWEYACRAGSKSRFFFGDDDDKLVDYAWYAKNSDNKPNPVGQKKPNDFGLYDMHANVWQYCLDWYDENYYTNATNTDPVGPVSGSRRVLRGGCWVIRFPAGCRSAYRSSDSPDERSAITGFRVVVELK